MKVFNTVKKAVKNWWVSLLIGILAIVLGIWCLVTPDKSLLGLTYIFVVAFFVGGLLEIIFALSNRQILVGWGWTLAGGILEILLGVFLLSMPTIMITVILIYTVGFWLLFRSIWSIAESFELQQIGVKGWGWLLALGILSVIFSFLYLMSPIFGGVFIIVFAGIALLVYGFFRIGLSFHLRTIHKEIKDID